MIASGCATSGFPNSIFATSELSARHQLSVAKSPQQVAAGDLHPTTATAVVPGNNQAIPTELETRHEATEPDRGPIVVPSTKLPEVRLAGAESFDYPFLSAELQSDAASLLNPAEAPGSEDSRGVADDRQNENGGPPETLPAPSDDSGKFSQQTLTLQDVIFAVNDSYPLLAVALGELDSAEGKALGTWGGFDTSLYGYAIAAPLGFYENYRNRVVLTRPLWDGGEIYSGYRMGDGNIQPWFGERETNEGGEFKTGVKQPLLKGFAIDERRADIQRAELERVRLEPDIMTRVLEFQRAAALFYWEWVAAGQAVQTQEDLFELAQKRNQQLLIQVAEGDLPRLAEVDNGRFIAKRRATLIATRRKLQEAAIKLSLFYRDNMGQPRIAADEQLPQGFPAVGRLDPSAVQADVARALENRPELRELAIQLQQVNVELAYAQNLTLPKLDAFAEAGQDVGQAASSKRDKSPFELEVGLVAEVPIQRREAVGKIRAAQGKISQINAKRAFVEDKIQTQVQDAVSGINMAVDRITQSRNNVRLSRESLGLGRIAFEDGDIDLIALNIYETSVAEAELELIDAEFAYFAALADYRAALALEQLDTPIAVAGIGEAIPPRFAPENVAPPRPLNADDDRRP